MSVDANATAEEVAMQLIRNQIICVGVAAGLYIFCLIFGGIGLYSMAKRAGLKHKWLAFVPFANTYYAGTVAGEAYFFGQKMKREGLYAMLAEIVYVGLNVFVLVINFLTYNPNYLYLDTSSYDYPVWSIDSSRFPVSLAWLPTAKIWSDPLSYLSEIVMIVFFFVVYNALFRKYYARGPMMMAFLSAIFPFRAFTLFAVRNNAPVDYNAYMKRKMEETMRSRQQYNGQYGPYGQNGQYGQYGQNRQGNPSEGSPFSEYGGDGDAGAAPSGSDEPFSEFGGTPPKDD